MIYNYPEVVAARKLMRGIPARFGLRTYPGDRFRVTADSTTLFLERVKKTRASERFEPFGTISSEELRAFAGEGGRREVRKLKNEGWLKDALYNLDAGSGANLDYCRGLVVGVISTRMAGGLTFQAALDEVARLMPHNATALAGIPEGWLNYLKASLERQGVEL